jgi:hypothetical protein
VNSLANDPASASKFAQLARPWAITERRLPGGPDRMELRRHLRGVEVGDVDRHVALDLLIW